MEGVDCERYLAADAYIGQNQDSFTAENGLETLKRTIQTEGGYPTQTSTVYDPTNGEIYLTIRGDFERIWKVSLAQKTIESYRGFTQPVRLKLDEQGLTAQELIELASVPQTGPDAPAHAPERSGADLREALSPDLPAKQAVVLGPLAIAGICLAVLCIVAVVWFFLSSRRKRR